MEVSYLISVFTSVTVDLAIRGVLKVWQIPSVITACSIPLNSTYTMLCGSRFRET